MAEQQRLQQLIRDGDIEDDQPMQQDDDDGGMDMQHRQMYDDGKSKLVQEAKAMMKEDEEEDKPAVDENAGPKIKMGRIRKKKPNAKDAAKKGEEATGSGFGAQKEARVAMEDEPRSNEGFSEQDIEFMR